MAAGSGRADPESRLAGPPRHHHGQNLMRPAATPARPEGGEKDGPAAAVLAGRAGFRRPALAAARRREERERGVAAALGGGRPSRPARGATRGHKEEID